MELKTIKLLGAAGRQFIREIKLAVQSPAEALRALFVLFPDFRRWIMEQSERGIAWKIVLNKKLLDNTTDLNNSTSSDTIAFVPIIQGKGDVGKAITTIFIGVALIAAAIFVPAIAAIGINAQLSVGLIGAGLVFGGVSSLLSPTPVIPQTRGGMTSPSSTSNGLYGGVEASQTKQLESNLFNRGSGTGAQGEAVPVLFGQRSIPVPRKITFSLENLPKNRSIATNELNVTDLIGYVNKQDLT